MSGLKYYALTVFPPVAEKQYWPTLKARAQIILSDAGIDKPQIFEGPAVKVVFFKATNGDVLPRLKNIGHVLVEDLRDQCRYDATVAAVKAVTP